ncbi:hypothetical protein FOCC_FOCC000686, partial [Frankliniella occidentalis]
MDLDYSKMTGARTLAALNPALVLVAMLNVVFGVEGQLSTTTQPPTLAEIRNLLDSLNITDNYWVRPDLGPTTINISLGIKSITLEWRDSSRVWSNSDNPVHRAITVLPISKEHIWHPDIVLKNSWAGKGVSLLGGASAELHSDGRIVWRPAALFEAYCQLDLRKWPFERHVCSLHFGSWTLSSKELKIGEISHKLEFPGEQTGEFIVDRVEQTFEERREDGVPEPFDGVVYSIALHREPGTYNAVIFAPAAGHRIPGPPPPRCSRLTIHGRVCPGSRRHPLPVYIPDAAARRREGDPGWGERRAHLPLPHLLRAQSARAHQPDALYRGVLLGQPVPRVHVAGRGRGGAQHLQASALDRAALDGEAPPHGDVRPRPSAQQLHRTDHGRGPRPLHPPVAGALLLGPPGRGPRDERRHGRPVRVHGQLLLGDRQQERQPEPRVAAAGRGGRPRAVRHLQPDLPRPRRGIPNLMPSPFPPASIPQLTKIKRDCFDG